jgi:hypothetical protein
MSFAVRPVDEDFLTEFAEGYSSERELEFLPLPPASRQVESEMCSCAHCAEHARERFIFALFIC